MYLYIYKFIFVSIALLRIFFSLRRLYCLHFNTTTATHVCTIITSETKGISEEQEEKQ